MFSKTYVSSDKNLFDRIAKDVERKNGPQTFFSFSQKKFYGEVLSDEMKVHYDNGYMKAGAINPLIVIKKINSGLEITFKYTKFHWALIVFVMLFLLLINFVLVDLPFSIITAILIIFMLLWFMKGYLSTMAKVFIKQMNIEVDNL